MAHYDGYVEAAREQYIAKIEAKVRELEERLAQKDETLGGLSRNYQNLMAFYDQHVGTPCEQIRHQQKIESLGGEAEAGGGWTGRKRRSEHDSI